ncbi:DoxX family protein [Streptomyces sp. NPDC050535]|uniref:DoxX family protein n=1 Tax=Streptomyces sp. NPDC050535 TaxID=3365626 RepID=UPI00379566D9
MFIATVAVSVPLALILLFSARGKLVRDPMQMKTLERVGFPENQVKLLAAAEIAGAVGILLGLAWWPLGVAAAIGIVTYFSGALISHLRVRDWKFAPVLILLLAGAAALLLRLASR